MDLKVDLAGGLGICRAWNLPHRDMRRTWQAELLTEIELCLPSGCTRSALGRLARHEELTSTTHLLWIEHLLIRKHLLLLGIVHLLLLLLHHAGVYPLAHRSALHMLLIHKVDLHLLLLLLLHESLLFDCCGHRFGALWTYPTHLVLNLLGLETVLVWISSDLICILFHSFGSELVRLDGVLFVHHWLTVLILIIVSTAAALHEHVTL